MALVVGIDLGTTNSCIAVYRNQSVEIIESKDLKKTIPSYVCYEPDGKVIVGRKAEEKAKVYPDRCIYDSKRFIGMPFNDDHIQVIKKNVPFPIVEGEDGECRFIVFQKDQQRKIRPEEVSADILRELKQNAEEFLGEKIVNAVITVPAYFNNSQKQATKDAAKIAGLNVLKLVTEPVAAALAFTHKTELKREKLVLVYDLGGGTFDVSLVKLNNKKIKTVAIAGERFLGGRDFDRRLMVHVLETLIDGETVNDINLRRIKRRLQTECEILKKNLSQGDVAELELYELLEGQNLEMTVTRRAFEELNIDLFKKTIKIIDKLLSSEKIKKKKIDEILLVGGSTRIPKIKQLVEDYFEGKELNHTVNPDEAVAIGAAIQAALLSDHPAQEYQKCTVIDVVPRSLGIEVIGERSMSIHITKNTKIPCEIKKTYFTHKDNQQSATFRVFEGESDDVNENSLLGEFIIQNITQKKRGEVQFDVIFSMDLNGILTVTATETIKKISRNLEIALYSGRMTEQEIEELRMMISRRLK